MSGPKGNTLALKISGLFTNPNTFSEVPEGLTLSRAANVVLDKDSILNSRRGFAQYGNAPGAPPYTHWLTLSTANGYDGDTGVIGHIGDVAPYNVTLPGDALPQTDNGFNTIPLQDAMGAVGKVGMWHNGAGDPASTVPNMVPMALLSGRSISDSTFTRPVAMFPCQPGDGLWVVSSSFPGYGLAYNVTVNVGPSETVGERYYIFGTAWTGSSESFGIQRLANAGGRVTPTATTNWKIKNFFDFKDVILTANEVGTLAYDASGDGTAWTAYSGTYLPPSGSGDDRLVSYQASKNLFIGTSEGVFKLESPTSEPRLAGVAAGLGGSGVTSGAAGFMLTATNVAYRVVWGYRDLNENLVLGAPSDRIVVSNTSGGDRDVALTFFIPADITTSYFYQIYRSAGSAAIDAQPDDELQLVYEASPTSGEITAGTVTVTDSTPDNLRGVLIYTAPSLTTLGILNSNFRPPFCGSMCTFNNHAFFGNTRTKHSLSLTLIASGSPDGIQVNDTITFSDGFTSFTLTGKATETPASGFFKVTTSLTPAENIDATARSIVSVLNGYASNTIIAAYYTSGFDELPGRMLFDRLTLSPTAFTVVCSRSTCFRPVIPVAGSSYNNTSRNEVRPNRVYYSKLQEYEAVPVIQYFDIGSPEEPIRGLVPLRDGVIVLKTDGVYRISGNDRASFTVNPIDTTVSILAQYSVAVLSNRVFFFSEQGIVAVSDNAAEIVSRPIETELLQYSSSVYPNFANVTFAVGYESDRKYILYTVTTSEDTYGTQAYIFNTLTGEWTRWDKPASAAFNRQLDDKLYLAGPAANETANFVFKERKSYNLSDFADEQYETTITAATGLTVTVPTSALYSTGYTLQQVTATARVVEVTQTTGVVPVQLWHFDVGGTDTSSVEGYILDLEPGGSPVEMVISASQSRFGGKSLAIGGGAEVPFPAVPTSPNLTVDFSLWIPTALSAGGILFDVNRDDGVLEMYVEFNTSGPSTGSLSFVFNQTVTKTVLFPTDTWAQFGLEFDDLNINIYLNGALVDTLTRSSVNFSPGISWVGNYRRGGYNYNYGDPVFLDELRFSNTALYEGSSYTVATEAYEVGAGSETVLTMDSVQDWVVGDQVTVFRPIFQYFETNQFDAGQPGIMKHWADCSLIYRSTDFTTMQLGFQADTTNEIKNVTLNAPAGTGGWGTFPWGTLPWGVSLGSKARIRTSVPKQAMRSNWISLSGTLNEAFSDISLAGVSLTYSGMSSRQKGGSRV